MKQRVKLAQAIFSDTPALLLDEPCTIWTNKVWTNSANGYNNMAKTAL